MSEASNFIKTEESKVVEENLKDPLEIIKAAAEKANVTADMSTSDMCNAIKTAMTEITVTGVTGEMTWSADGEPTKSPKAMVIKDGTYAAL